MIEAAAGRTEKERKIPADVLSAMHACGLFHMLLPVSLGGAAVDLVTFNQVVEAVAAADASPAWCLAQAVATSHAAGFLDPKIAREVFGAPDALVAWGPPAGVAKAIIVDGGYRVTGKWRFASGSANATWMGGHSTVFETVKSFPYNSLLLTAVIIAQHVSRATSTTALCKNLQFSVRPVPIPVPILAGRSQRYFDAAPGTRPRSGGCGAELIAAPQLVGHTLQEGIATTDVERSGGRHDGVELGIGETDGRHGG